MSVDEWGQELLLLAARIQGTGVLSLLSRSQGEGESDKSTQAAPLCYPCCPAVVGQSPLWLAQACEVASSRFL